MHGVETRTDLDVSYNEENNNNTTVLHWITRSFVPLRVGVNTTFDIKNKMNEKYKIIE